MWRYLAGVASALLLTAAGFLVWTGLATKDVRIPPPPLALTTPANATDAPPEAPQASDKTREEKRFSRADHDKDGSIARDEYLAARHRNFTKLDLNGDGRLSFDEYAAKAEAKFAAADADKSGTLDAKEFATTRVIRKLAPRCPPASPAAPAAAAGESDDG